MKLSYDVKNSKNQEKKETFLCDNCHRPFTSKNYLIKHLENSELCFPKFSPSNDSEKIKNLKSSENIQNENFMDQMASSTEEICTNNQSINMNKLNTTQSNASKVCFMQHTSCVEKLFLFSLSKFQLFLYCTRN